MLTFEMVREAKQNWPKSKLAQVEIGRNRNWPKSKLAEIELAELEKKNWPKSKLAEVDHDRQIAYLIYEQFRVTGTDSSVETYTDLFTIAVRNDDIQEFDSKWDGILLSVTKIPPDDILEGLYKLRIRGSEKLKTVLELYNMEIHQKKAGPDSHRLKTTVKRCVEQISTNQEF